MSFPYLFLFLTWFFYLDFFLFSYIVPFRKTFQNLLSFLKYHLLFLFLSVLYPGFFVNHDYFRCTWLPKFRTSLCLDRSNSKFLIIFLVFNEILDKAIDFFSFLFPWAFSQGELADVYQLGGVLFAALLFGFRNIKEILNFRIICQTKFNWRTRGKTKIFLKLGIFSLWYRFWNTFLRIAWPIVCENRISAGLLRLNFLVWNGIGNLEIRFFLD